jgi:hypothetical protein
MEEVIEDRSSAADGLRERGDLVRIKAKGERMKEEFILYPLPFNLSGNSPAAPQL